jgi:hypothetical protein
LFFFFFSLSRYLIYVQPEFEQINRHVLLHLRQRLPHLYDAAGESVDEHASEAARVATPDPTLIKPSICSEVTGSITDW